MSQNKILENMKRNLRETKRLAALNSGMFKLRRALKKLKNTPIILNRHQEAATQIQKAWKELNKSKIPKFKEERSKKLAKEANNLMRNILRMNNLPKTSILGKRRNTDSNSNSNNNQAKTYKKREVNLPNLAVDGFGMRSPCGGIARYMKRAQKTFNDASVVSAYLDYSIASNQYGILKNIDAIVKSRGAANTSSRIIATKQVHFFMVAMRGDAVGHAVSVLVDPGVYTSQFRIWVFDPHGEASTNSIWGRTMREKVVPIIKQLWGITNTNNRMTRYYNGPNLQANNNNRIGVCTTFYVTFMEYIRALIAGRNINGITEYAALDSIERRKFFLDFPPNIQGLVIAKNRTR